MILRSTIWMLSGLIAIPILLGVSVEAQQVHSVGSLRKVLPPTTQELVKPQEVEKKGGDDSAAKRAEESLIQKYSGDQEQGRPEEIPVPRQNGVSGNDGSVTLDENGNPISRSLDTSNAEVIRQRYPDGKIQVIRHVVQDEDGDYHNHGPWKLFNKNGQILAEGIFVNGYMEGSWQRWHNSSSDTIFSTAPFTEYKGPFLSVAYFRKGKIHGTWIILDPMRRKVFELGYQDGKRNGVAIWWYPNGMKMRQMGFQDGILHGELIQWDKKGQIKRREKYIKGQQIVAKTENWHANQKRSENYFLGPRLEVSEDDDWWNAKPSGYNQIGGEVQHGLSSEWYRNGQPKKRGRFDKGQKTGNFTWWFVNGQKMTSGDFAEDLRIGKWMWWHDNGMKSISGQYEDGKPVGTWTWWNAEGKKIREANLDEVPEEIEYDLPNPDADTDPRKLKEESILSGMKK